METSQFILEGYCKGSYPVEGLEELLKESWLPLAIKYIRDGDEQKSTRLIESHFTAEFSSMNIDTFESNQIKFVKTLSTNFSTPAIVCNESGEFPIFKWIGAHFLMEAPTSIVSKWLSEDKDGEKIFSQQNFDNWLSRTDPLQDGCIYHLGPCWYDLDGFGTNGCSIIGSSVILGLNKCINTESIDLITRHDALAGKKKKLLEALPSKEPLRGEDLLFINALMEEECPSEERRPEMFEVAEKWARLAGYQSLTLFYEALLDAMQVPFGSQS